MSTTTPIIVFTHAFKGDDELILRWNHRLKYDAERELETCLEGIHGVETVHVRHYSAHVTFASHVTTPDAQLADVMDVVLQQMGPVLEEFAVIRFEPADAAEA